MSFSLKWVICYQILKGVGCMEKFMKCSKASPSNFTMFNNDLILNVSLLLLFFLLFQIVGIVVHHSYLCVCFTIVPLQKRNLSFNVEKTSPLIKCPLKYKNNILLTFIWFVQ